ncbi:MGMT family protein [candidate division WWE3 bacterium]|uniref:Methylated-DNA--protein-cysteine methyltransferase n=1 Tax=candidate division WWE3 bacterium TaxID=2053526 RepID=A0A955RQ44_UNCKA|nr:MGMT family protein [candidate division WWE3 bacterium]
MLQQTFTEKVYRIVARIPEGKVMTYGQVAVLAGSAGAARAVGMCMKNNPDTTIVPCHRVVASNGDLTGYSGGQGVKTKKEKLLSEGVIFDGERVDLDESQWTIE